MKTASWKRTTLGAICDEVGGVIKTGPFGAQLHESDYVDEGVPVVMPKDIIEGKVRVATIARIGHEDLERLSQHKLKAGDIVYGRRGDIGRQALISRREQGWLCGTGCLRISLGDKVVDPTFLHYYLRDEKVIREIANQAVGATMPNLNTTILRSIKVRHPDLSTQRKIAGILSAYDDLIENNLRRIKILEEMAQTLYREWFVHFRFPGHESAKFVDSALGQIPKGWEVKKLGQVAKIVMGLSPKGDTYNDQGDGMPLVNGPVEFSERFTKRIKWTTSPTKTCKAGDLVVCVRGSTTGKNVKSDGEYCLGRGVCSISSEYQSFVDQMFANELPTLLGMTSGSTFPSWTGPVLQSHPVISPPKTLVAEFDRLALPMSDTIQSLAFKNDNLRRTRDLLLPKLLSCG